MKSTAKVKQNKDDVRLHASPAETPARVRGLKRPNPQLAELIGLANLIPWDVAVPEELLSPKSLWSTQALLDSLAGLPERLRLHLLEVFNSETDLSIGAKPLVLEVLKVNEVRTHYASIRSARNAFETILAINRHFLDVDQEFEYFDIQFGPALTLRVDSTGNGVEKKYPTSAELQDFNIRYIRRCAACGEIFFAGRIFTDPTLGAGCSRSCNKKLRNDKWKAKYKAGDYKIYPLGKGQ